MFDIGWSELLIIGIVALIAIGPKELPNVLRTVGQYMGKVRRMASEFQSQFNEAMREAEMADIKKQVDELSNAASSYTNFDPIGNLESEFKNAIEDRPAQTTAAGEPAAEPAPPPSATPGEPAPVAQDNPQDNTQDNASPPPEPAPVPAAAEAPPPKVGSAT